MKKAVLLAALILLLLGAAAIAPLPKGDRPSRQYMDRQTASAKAKWDLLYYFSGKGSASPNGGYTGSYFGSRINLDGSLTVLLNDFSEIDQTEIREVCGEAEVTFEMAEDPTRLSTFVIRNGVEEYLLQLLKQGELDSFGLAPYGGGLLEVTIPEEYMEKIGPKVAQYVEATWPEEVWRISYRVGRFVPY